MNRLHNVNNPYQGTYKKSLCVCSAGLLRSPTLAEILIKEYGHNARAVGANKEYALIVIDAVLIAWADEIVFVNKENYEEVCKDSKLAKILTKKTVKILDIEDSFEFREEPLIQALKEAYEKATPIIL